MRPLLLREEGPRVKSSAQQKYAVLREISHTRTRKMCCVVGGGCHCACQQVVYIVRKSIFKILFEKCQNKGKHPRITSVRATRIL